MDRGMDELHAILAEAQASYAKESGVFPKPILEGAVAWVRAFALGEASITDYKKYISVLDDTSRVDIDNWVNALEYWVAIKNRFDHRVWAGSRRISDEGFIRAYAVTSTVDQGIFAYVTRLLEEAHALVAYNETPEMASEPSPPSPDQAASPLAQGWTLLMECIFLGPPIKAKSVVEQHLHELGISCKWTSPPHGLAVYPIGVSLEAWSGNEITQPFKWISGQQYYASPIPLYIIRISEIPGEQCALKFLWSPATEDRADVTAQIELCLKELHRIGWIKPGPMANDPIDNLIATGGEPKTEVAATQPPVSGQEQEARKKRERGANDGTIKNCEKGLKEWLDNGHTRERAAQLAGVHRDTMLKRIPDVLKTVDEATRVRWTERIRAEGKAEYLSSGKVNPE